MYKLYMQIVALTVTCCFMIQCALSGVIVNHGNFETPVREVALEPAPMLKVYYGGVRCELSLKAVDEIIINPAQTFMYENELYYSAEITLKDGTRLQSLSKDRSEMTTAYVCVQQFLVGRSSDGQIRVGLETLLRISIR